jgi:hypothetical protein
MSCQKIYGECHDVKIIHLPKNIHVGTVQNVNADCIFFTDDHTYKYLSVLNANIDKSTGAEYFPGDKIYYTKDTSLPSEKSDYDYYDPDTHPDVVD